MKYAILSFFISLSLFATDYMIGFDPAKVLTDGSFTRVRETSKDSDQESSDGNYFNLNFILGKRFHPRYQLLLIFNYARYIYPSSNEYHFTEAGTGVEYNFHDDFSQAYFTSASVTTLKEVEKLDSQTSTTAYQSLYISAGKRFPLFGNKGYLSYSPDITYRLTTFGKKNNRKNTQRFIFNFIKLDLLF